uniref:Uncharacterized protein n=1 Tax=Anguilla anguilla TaxID=7936 RepID=A0A0E9US42_ANGAN
MFSISTASSRENRFNHFIAVRISIFILFY